MFLKHNLLYFSFAQVRSPWSGSAVWLAAVCSAHTLSALLLHIGTSRCRAGQNPHHLISPSQNISLCHCTVISGILFPSPVLQYSFTHPVCLCLPCFPHSRPKAISIFQQAFSGCRHINMGGSCFSHVTEKYKINSKQNVMQRHLMCLPCLHTG